MRDANTVNYDQLTGLEGVYLEDSYVMDILISPSKVEFAIEFVLTESHPRFTPPPPNEQYCYRQGRLIFEEFDHLLFEFRPQSRTTDADNNLDYGNIDSFVVNGIEHRLEGDWGKLELIPRKMRVELDS